MIEISDYDKFNYDYSTYWNDRKYENRAEHQILEKIFNEIPSGDWILDVGGSYGRLTDTYYTHFKHSIILDYSLETLKKNYAVIKESYPKTILIAANAYYLPFKSSSLDTVIMVRVLHHLNKPEKYFKELNRVIKENGKYIQEFANKVHIKARFKAILRGDFKFFSKKPYQQPTIGNFEGTKDQRSIFLNYHPKYIKKLFKSSNLSISKKYGCSFFRIPLLKRKLNLETLLKFEFVAQKFLSWTNLPPSIFFTAHSTKNLEKGIRYRKIEDILVCPKCKKILSFSQNTATCRECDSVFKKENNIWDFRVK